MLHIIASTAIYICLSIAIRIEEVREERAWRECEETDWNEYYANL